MKKLQFDEWVFTKVPHRGRRFRLGTPAVSGVSDIVDLSGTPNVVDEVAANGTPVGITAYAIDPGHSVNYTLSDDAGGRFAINSSSGVVTKAGSIDYFVASSHTVTIRATTSRDGSFKELEVEIAVYSELALSGLFAAGMWSEGMWATGYFAGH